MGNIDGAIVNPYASGALDDDWRRGLIEKGVEPVSMLSCQMLGGITITAPPACALMFLSGAQEICTLGPHPFRVVEYPG